MDAIDASMAASNASTPSMPRSDKHGNLDEDIEMSELLSSSPLTEVDSEEKSLFSPLPDSVLLLNLPSILMHPPNHPLHAQSLCMSLLALRRCLEIPGLSPDVECRALTSVAEIGMTVIDGGFNKLQEHVWAHGIETEVEQATSKGLLIAQKHPNLRIYRSQITFLSVQLASWQHDLKYANMKYRQLLSTYLPSDPPHIVYTCHLKLIVNLITPKASNNTSGGRSSSPTKIPQDTRLANSAIHAMQNHASENGHTGVVLLTHVLRLRYLISSGLWEQVGEALYETEQVLGIEFSSEPDAGQQPDGLSPRKGLRVTDLNTVHMNAPSPLKLSHNKSSTIQCSPAAASPAASAPAQPSFKMFDTHFERSMALHTLILGVIFCTYVGKIDAATQRLSHLHALLDAGVLRFDKKPSTSVPSESSEISTYADPTVGIHKSTPEGIQERDEAACGIVRIPISDISPPLYVQTTHPRILYVLAYLVSCVAKKDPVGRKPKRKIFAIEGLTAWEKEIRRELRLSSWASMGDLEEINLKLAKIKADLMCELIGISIMRSEFKVAEETLAVLIAHLRNADIFASFSSRVTLHHAHLAHAKGQTVRALECYQVAEAFAEERGDDFVRISARAGRVCLKIGLIRDKEFLKKEEEEANQDNEQRKTRSKSKERKAVDKDAMDVDEEVAAGFDDPPDLQEWDEVQQLAEDVAEACRGMGGTMWGVGRVIEACLTDEILKAKQHLKSALSFATFAGDNHLRALILALIASHYFHTATNDALSMLGMCENLASGLGAAVKPPGAKSKDKSADAIGNAPLRTWVGERSLEIFKRTGNAPASKKQEAANRALHAGIRRAEKRVAKSTDL